MATFGSTPEPTEPVTITIPASLILEMQKIRNFDPNASGNTATLHVRTARETIERLFSLHPVNFNPELEDEHEAIQADFQHAQNQLTELRAAHVTLQENHNRIIQIAAAASTSNTRPAFEAAKLPDPPMYNGDRKELRNFLAQIRLKLAQNSSRFPTEQDKLRYTISRLEGLALSQVIPHIRDDYVNFENFPALVTLLENAFGDPDRTATAERELAKLQQKNREFSLYLADFQRTIADLDYNDVAKLSALRRGLSTELKEALSYQADPPTDLNAFIRLCNKLDSNIRALSADRASKNINYNKFQMRSPNSQTTVHPTDNSSGNHGLAPMDLSAVRRKLTPEERAKRIAEGRCVYCNEFNHWARDCPNKRPRPPMRAAAAETQGATEPSGKA